MKSRKVMTPRREIAREMTSSSDELLEQGLMAQNEKFKCSAEYSPHIRYFCDSKSIEERHFKMDATFECAKVTPPGEKPFDFFPAWLSHPFKTSLPEKRPDSANVILLQWLSEMLATLSKELCGVRGPSNLPYTEFYFFLARFVKTLIYIFSPRVSDAL